MPINGTEAQMNSEQGELFLWYTDTPGTRSGTTITYTAPYVIYLGHVNKISESFSKSTSVVPLVTLGASNAFPLDGGTGRTYSFNGSRQQPTNWQATDDTTSSKLGPNETLPTTASGWNAILTKEYKWSCKKWITELQAFIDRWQMKTDGCFIVYRPASTNPYVRLGTRTSGYYTNMIHGYLKSIEFTYNSDYNEHVTFYLTMTVGTCKSTPYLDTFVTPPYTSGESVTRSESGITLSDDERNQYYPIGSLAGAVSYQGTDYPCESAVDSYTITGGPNQPFETISMTIPKTKLSTILNAFVDVRRYLVEGQNIITVNAVGKDRTFLLSSVKSIGARNGTIKIQGRNLAYKFKASANQMDEIVGLPFGIIKNLLYSGKYGPPYGANNFKYLVRKEYDTANAPQSEVLTFKKGRSIWDILQICAISIKAKLFFIGDKAYLIDYTIPFDDYSNSTLYSTNLASTDLFRYTQANSTYINQTNGSVLTGDTAAIRVFPDVMPDSQFRNYMSGRVVGNCSFENQGTDTVTQTVTVNCSTPFLSNTEDGLYTEYDEIKCVKYTDQKAKSWNEKNGNPDEEYGVIFDIDDLLEGTGMDGVEYHQATTFAENYIEYMLEPQQPVSFEVKEYTDEGWQMLFPYLAQADSFLDESDDLGYITNESIYYDEDTSSYPRVPQKLCLSTYEFNYPDMTTRYTWGVVNNIDLSGRLADRF